MQKEYYKIDLSNIKEKSLKKVAREEFNNALKCEILTLANELQDKGMFSPPKAKESELEGIQGEFDTLDIDLLLQNYKDNKLPYSLINKLILSNKVTKTTSKFLFTKIKDNKRNIPQYVIANIRVIEQLKIKDNFNSETAKEFVTSVVDELNNMFEFMSDETYLIHHKYDLYDRQNLLYVFSCLSKLVFQLIFAYNVDPNLNMKKTDFDIWEKDRLNDLSTAFYKLAYNICNEINHKTSPFYTINTVIRIYKCAMLLNVTQFDYNTETLCLDTDVVSNMDLNSKINIKKSLMKPLSTKEEILAFSNILSDFSTVFNMNSEYDLLEKLTIEEFELFLGSNCSINNKLEILKLLSSIKTTDLPTKEMFTTLCKYVVNIDLLRLVHFKKENQLSQVDKKEMLYKIFEKIQKFVFHTNSLKKDFLLLKRIDKIYETITLKIYCVKTDNYDGVLFKILNLINKDIFLIFRNKLHKREYEEIPIHLANCLLDIVEILKEYDVYNNTTVKLKEYGRNRYFYMLDVINDYN